MKLIEAISNFLAIWLDKLKMANPLVFVIVQAVLLIVRDAFVSNNINIPTPDFFVTLLGFLGINDGFDGLIAGILIILVAANGARTAMRVANLKK